AGVVRNGRALLLVGPSAVDLSTLSYACVWAGFGLMAAETTWVSLGRGQRLWGHASPIRMPVDAVRFFPDLAGVAPGMGANGEPTLAIDIEARWPERLATHAERAVVCLIERAAGQASRLEPVPAAAAAAIMGDLRAPGHSRLSEQAPAVVQALTARGAHRLSLGADPASAAALLAHLAEAGQW
ncbi:MAG: hypothetical protein HGA45_07485, partial [Chloroflexales bacterium]|nr:hypothetical protein [Chloroflexales bacterium]